MAYIFTAITGSDTVGQAFTKVNQNLQEVENNQGTQGNFVPLSGLTFSEPITGDLYQRDKTFYWDDNQTIQGVAINYSSITFQDLDDNSNIVIKPYFNSYTNVDVNILDTRASGHIPIVPAPFGEDGKLIRVESGGLAWEYIDPSALGFFTNGGGTITGDTTIDQASLIIKNNNVDQTMTLSGNAINFYDDPSSSSLTLQLPTSTLGANRTVNFADKDGTIAIAEDVVGKSGDTIYGVYTINDTVSNGPKIDMVGTTPLINLEGDSPAIRLNNTDIVGKLNLYSDSIVFDNNGVGASSSVISIVPQLTLTGNCSYTIPKVSGASVNGYIVAVNDIVGKPNEVIKVNTNGNGFETIVFSGSGSVGVNYSPTSITVIGSGATRVTSAGTGTINILSSITSNNLVQKSIAQGSQMLITDNGSGTITFAANPSEGVLFNALGNTAVSNLNTENSVIFSSVRGGTTLSASTATTLPQQTAGRRYRFTANGTIQSHSTAGTFVARMKLGSVLIASSATFTLHNSIPANTTFFIEATFTVRTAGAAGTIQSRGIMHITHSNFVANGSNSAGIIPVTTTNFNTQTDKVFDFTLQFGTANANNAWVINEASLEYLDI